MRYLNPAPFSIPPPAAVTCCERCVYARGAHAPFCTAFDAAVERAYLRTLTRALAGLLRKPAEPPAQWLDDGGLAHESD